MSLSLILAALWVLAATIVAMLPMKHQYVPGVILLIAAPFGIAFIGYEHGWLIAALGTAAFISMFRNPLRYLYKRAKGEHPEIPK
ncbi:MAG: DUF2484 family protein [Pseudomonadota bacterium]